jgi:hypothetical protein
MTRYAYTGGPSTGLPQTMRPATGCWLLPDFSDERAAAEGEGLVANVSVRPSAGSPLAWSTRGGGGFALLSLDASITFHARTGRLIAPGEVPWIISGEPASYTVPAGRYKTITYHSDVELAVLDPPARDEARIRVIGGDWGLLPGTVTR